ncbi:unnamed protein product, partial [Brassica oleracea var. botrytis]
MDKPSFVISPEEADRRTRIFLGVNVEFPGLPLHHSIHAEQFLVTNLTLNDERHLRHFAVSAAPCGHCR